MKMTEKTWTALGITSGIGIVLATIQMIRLGWSGKKNENRLNILVDEARRHFAEKAKLGQKPSLQEYMEIPEVKEIVNIGFKWEKNAVNVFMVLETQRTNNNQGE